MIKRRTMIGLVLFAVLVFTGCNNTEETIVVVEEQETEPQDATQEMDAMHGVADKITFADAVGREYDMEVDLQANLNMYEEECFYREDGRVIYDGEGYKFRHGVDVSYYQENIDWEKVKADGMEFAIIRIGYRGYGGAGTLNLDGNFEQNIQGAQKAGLDVGVYFFAQAVNEQEAIEEAEFVLQYLKDYELEMPVVYDPETVLESGARTTGVSREQFTKNAKAFCDTVEKAGYESMIYCKMLWQAFELDMSELTDYRIWYADYERHPQTPYHFEMWQYTQEGSVDGINGDVDINIQLIKDKK